MMRRKASGSLLPSSSFDVEGGGDGSKRKGGAKRGGSDKMALIAIGVFVALMVCITVTVRVRQGDPRPKGDGRRRTTMQKKALESRDAARREAIASASKRRSRSEEHDVDERTDDVQEHRKGRRDEDDEDGYSAEDGHSRRRPKKEDPRASRTSKLQESLKREQDRREVEKKQIELKKASELRMKQRRGEDERKRAEQERQAKAREEARLEQQRRLEAQNKVAEEALAERQREEDLEATREMKARAQQEVEKMQQQREENWQREKEQQVPRGGRRQEEEEKLRRNDFVTKKEKHSGPPVLSVTEEHHHVLAYYVRALRSGILEKGTGATVLHIDSHADMGVPSSFVQDHGLETFDLEKAAATNSRALEEYAEINDFLLLGAHVGLIDHIVFVEPPWSNQFRCCVYRTNQTFDFAVGLDDEQSLRVDVVGDTAKLFARERFGHVFWRNGERRTGTQDKLTHLRPFKVTVVAQEHPDLPVVISDVVDKSKPLVVDVDLDAFTTVSPGAIATKARFGLKDDHLETLYHLVWNFPALGIDYLSKKDPGLRDSTSADVFLNKAKIIAAASPQNTERPTETSRLAHALEKILESRDVQDQRRRTILAYAAAIDTTTSSHSAQPFRPIDARSQANLEAFLEQPLHVPSDLSFELEYVLAETWTRVLKKLPDPFLVSLVRSPGYVPEDALSSVECRIIDYFAKLFDIHHLDHEDRVDPKRTDCIKEISKSPLNTNRKLMDYRLQTHV